MNMRTTLMLMAATVAPLYAQQSTAPVAQVYTDMATPATTATATPTQRAAAYPALALIPTDVESVVTINDLAGIVNSAAQLGGEQAPAELMVLDSLAIATGKGTADAIKAAIPMLACKTGIDGKMEPLPQIDWGHYAKAPMAAIISQLADNYVKATKEAALKNISDTKLPPIYVVLTGKPQSEATLAEYYPMILEALTSDIEPDSKEELRTPVDVNGFSGIKLDIRGESFIDPDYEFDDEKDTYVLKELSEEQKILSAAIDKRSDVYVVLRQQGNAIIGVIAENPDDIKLPATAEESILNTPGVQAADANLDKSPVMLSYTAPAMLQNIAEIQYTPHVQIAQLVADTFTAMAAAATDAEKATFEAAAGSVNMLLTAAKSLLIPTGNVPDLCQIWKGENSIELQYTGNSQGISYAPGKLSLTAQADKPDTIFYAEQTPATIAAIPTCTDIIDAVVNAYNGYCASIKDEYKVGLEEQEAALAFLPECKELCNIFGSIGSGLGNSSAIVIDSAGSMPAILGGAPGNTTKIPRISFYSGVTDRTKLSDGWQSLLNFAAGVATKLGSDPTVVQMLPIVPTPVGNATSYSVALPWFTPDMVPNLTVSDTALAAGSSSVYNAELVTSATGNMDFAGAVFSLKFEPLAKTIRGIANELNAAAKAAAEPLRLGVEGEAEEEEIETDDEEYYSEEEEEFIAESDEEPSLQDSHDEIETAAQVLETIATVIDRVDGTITTTGDSQTIRVRVNLKKN